MQDIYYASKDGKNTVHACIWLPEGKICGVVQIIHGMAEYAARYAPFAAFLNEHGFAVCAEDHLGHGWTAKSVDDLGYFDDAHDYKTVLADIHALRLEMTRRTGEDTPYFVLGHSMGSFFCRNYIAAHGEGLRGAVIMGSGFKDRLTLGAALSLVRLNALFFGWRNRSAFIKKLAFGSYNKYFKPVRTDNDWLSRDSGNVDAYNADALCGVDFTNNGYYVLFSVIKAACSRAAAEAVPKQLPVYFVAGGMDPVGDYGRGVLKAKDKFAAAGVEHLSLTLYKGCRHEILNDECKQQVCGDILGFLESCLAGKQQS